MKNQSKTLDEAIQALKSTEPEPQEISTSAMRVAERLGLHIGADERLAFTIENCEDVQNLLSSFRAGTLSSAHSFLIEAHMRDCRACMRSYRKKSQASALDWSTPRQLTSSKSGFRVLPGILVTPRVWAWALAPALAVLACSIFLYKFYWQVPTGVRAEVRSVDGPAYRITDTGDHRVSQGDQLNEGDILRTGGDGHAVLQLADGSRVEMRERSVLGVGAKGHSMTLLLQNGAVIVQAAMRPSGHLYVRTPDCKVAVTGTIFSVDSGIKGSQVAVLRGSVQVAHAGLNSMVSAGNQISTSDNLSPEPIQAQIAWSHDLGQYLPLLAQLSTLQRSIEQIPFPQPRYTSDLLNRVPTDTILYASIPNLGNFLSEANTIFQEQLKQSPELQEWWTKAHKGDTDEFNSFVDKLHELSQYLGDEVVIVGVRQAGDVQHPGLAIVADIQKNGLEDLLKGQFSVDSAAPLTVLDENALNAASSSSTSQAHLYALTRSHEVIFSNSIVTLRQLNSQLNSGASGFSQVDFGKQITAAYQRGAGIIFAADLQGIMSNKLELRNARRSTSSLIGKSGLEEVRYLIAEHREKNGQPENHLNLQFTGTRQRVASWLAPPATIGSLDFVTPNAAVAVAVLSKDPKAIANDLLSMTTRGDGTQNSILEAESKTQISFRDDIAANLDGDFLLSLDGPVLPTPSWKVVVGVNDSQRLEQTLEQLARFTKSMHDQGSNKQSDVVSIESTEIGAQRFFEIHDANSSSIVAQYTFSDGYMIVAPTRALLIEALKAHASSNSLARSPSFKALLPRDENENYSAVAYQNLGPVLTPLLSQFSGRSADAIRTLATDARPTVVCAWGEDTRIEAASDSHLFGFDFLTLGSLLNSRNKIANPNVRE